MYKKNDIVIYKSTPKSKGILVKILIHRDNFFSYGNMPDENYDYYVRSEVDGAQFFVNKKSLNCID